MPKQVISDVLVLKKNEVKLSKEVDQNSCITYM